MMRIIKRALVLIMLASLAIVFYQFPQILHGHKRSAAKRKANVNDVHKSDAVKYIKLATDFSTVQKQTYDDVNKVSVPNSKVQRLTYDQRKRLQSALKNATNKITVLMWTGQDVGWIRDFVKADNCGTCEFTTDQSKLLDPNTKAVSFLFNQAISGMPKTRRKDQYWIWRTGESTRALKIQRGMSLKEYNNVFNLTLSYRRDSEMYSPYGSGHEVLQKRRNMSTAEINKELDDIIAKKTRSALFMASNCGFTKGANERIRLTDEMISLGFIIDRRGRCFPKSEPAPKGKDHELVPLYKFYLSFENDQFCKDYLTEKFLKNGLSHGTVPIVWGAKREDYEAVAPPHSFIYVHDYKTTAELVNYLRYLDGNATAYREYLQWRTMRLEDLPNYERSLSFCTLCRMLHGINVDEIFRPGYDPVTSKIPLFGFPKEPRIIPSIADWFYGTENRECLP